MSDGLDSYQMNNSSKTAVSVRPDLSPIVCKSYQLMTPVGKDLKH